MEENSAAVECLICFYIDAKHLLKTRVLDGSLFMGEMIQNCKQRGFHQYSDKEIIIAWKKLVAKYIYLKTKASPEEKESWKYFDIFDSCYEQSDFQDGRHAKFSEDMVWFLIECFLNRKGLANKQKHSDILNDIHKEFQVNGYLHISKHDIENKWKYLNLKYAKLKDDPERLNKLPYLQALKGYYKENENSLVNMIFTRDLTEKLIQWYTELKVSCVIHGYDSSQVLHEIQSKFAKIRYYFSIEAIKDKWRKLVNIYNYLLSKKDHQSTWIHFNSMKNHFSRNYLMSKDRGGVQIINKENHSKRRCPRQRSKSVGAKNIKNGALYPAEPEEIIIIDDEVVGVNKFTDAGRSSVARARSTSPRKRGRPRKTLQRDLGNNPRTRKAIDEQNDMHSRPRSKSVCSGLILKVPNGPDIDDNVEELPIGKKRPVKRPVNGELNTPYKKRLLTRDCPNVNISSDVEMYYSPSKNAQNESVNGAVQVAQVDQSNVSAGDLPPAAKQHWDMELLPFKKRLRMDKQASQPAAEDTTATLMNETQAFEQHSGKLDKEPLQNYKPNDKSNKFENCNVLYNDWQCQVKSEEEYQKSQLLQSVEGKTKNNPFVLFTVKIDAAYNLNNEATTNGIIEPLSDNHNESEEIINSAENEQDVEVSTDFSEPMDQDGNDTEFRTKENLVSDVEVNQLDTDAACNNKDMVPTENEPVCCIDLTNNDCNGASEACCTKETSDEHCYTQTETCKAQPSAEFVFRKPSLIVKKTVEATETLTSSPKSKNHQVDDNVVPTTKKKVKEIYISRKELSKLTALKPGTFLRTPNGSREANVKVRQSLPGFKFVSQVIKPGTNTNPMGGVNVECNDTTEASRVLESGKGGMNEEFETESVISEAPGEEGLKTNLLSTVTEFQEHNNQEFVEIKNLMQQNNLLQRETNRLLRLLLEKM